MRLIRSKAVREGAERALAAAVVRRRAVDVRVTSRLGEPFRVELRCVDGPVGPDGRTPHAEASGFVVERARTRVVTASDLREHVGRMGATSFEPRRIEVELDEGCGMAFSAVHEVRAAACEALETAVLAPSAARAGRFAAMSERLRPSERPDEVVARPDGEMGDAVRSDHGAGRVVLLDGRVDTSAGRRPGPVVAPGVEACALVVSPGQARAVLEAGATRVYVPSDELSRGSWPAGCVPVLDEVCREPDHARLDAWVRSGASVAVGNVSELALAAEVGALPEVRGCVPVHNASALGVLEQAGAVGLWLSPELTLAEVAPLAARAHGRVGMVVSGRPRVMTTEHCVLRAADACAHDCARCPTRARPAFLRRAGRLLPVRTDLQGRSRIYDASSLDLTPEAGELVAAGVTRMAADVTLLDESGAHRAMARLVRALAAVAAGGRPSRRDRHATSGHLFAGIG